MTGKRIVVITSIVFMLIISAIGSLPVLFLGFNLANYLSVFAILIAVQLFIGGIWNYFIDKTVRLEMEKVDAANNLAYSVQHLKMDCAYCGTQNYVKILVGQENKFECEACKQKNSVVLSITTARITEPIMPKSELSEIFKGIDNKE